MAQEEKGQRRFFRWNRCLGCVHRWHCLVVIDARPVRGRERADPGKAGRHGRHRTPHEPRDQTIRQRAPWDFSINRTRIVGHRRGRMRLFRREATAQRTLLCGPTRPARVATGHHIAPETASRSQGLVTRARSTTRKEPLVLLSTWKSLPFSWRRSSRATRVRKFFQGLQAGIVRPTMANRSASFLVIGIVVIFANSPVRIFHG